MLVAILVFAVLAGCDNLNVCSALGALPLRRAQRVRFAFAFAACEAFAPLVGLAGGYALLSLAHGTLERAGPLAALACGVAVVVMALRNDDVSGVLDGKPLLFGLPLSLSLDNVVAGAGLGAMHYPVVLSAALVGLVSAAMSVAGLYCGAALRRLVPSRIELAVGAYLCALAVRTLFSGSS